MKPQTVTEMFPSKWLRGSDLVRPVVATVASVDVQEFWDLHTGDPVVKPVVSFQNASKKLIANKTQCLQLADVCGSERFSDWPGHTVTLAQALDLDPEAVREVVGDAYVETNKQDRQRYFER